MLTQLNIKNFTIIEEVSLEFKELARTSKPIMAILIEESCQKRARANDSLIMVWAHSKENEYTLFDRHVKTIKDFDVFMIDLYNFLGDLVHSCPIGQRQFKDRLEKFSKIRKLLPTLSLAPAQQQKFMRYIQSQLNKLEANKIDAAKLKELYNSFQRS